MPGSLDFLFIKNSLLTTIAIPISLCFQQHIVLSIACIHVDSVMWEDMQFMFRILYL